MYTIVNKLVNIYQRHAIQEEILITQKIQSKNMIRYYSVHEDVEKYYIFMEKCHGSFKSQIKNQFESDFSHKVSILRQIAQGLCDLAKEKYIHR